MPGVAAQPSGRAGNGPAQPDPLGTMPGLPARPDAGAQNSPYGRGARLQRCLRAVITIDIVYDARSPNRRGPL
jgi:hypothetical protein